MLDTMVFFVLIFDLYSYIKMIHLCSYGAQDIIIPSYTGCFMDNILTKRILYLIKEEDYDELYNIINKKYIFSYKVLIKSRHFNIFELYKKNILKLILIDIKKRSKKKYDKLLWTLGLKLREDRLLCKLPLCVDILMQIIKYLSY